MLGGKKTMNRASCNVVIPAAKAPENPNNKTGFFDVGIKTKTQEFSPEVQKSGKITKNFNLKIEQSFQKTQ